MKLKGLSYKQLKGLTTDTRFLYPIMFLLVNMILLLMEYIRLGGAMPVIEGMPIFYAVFSSQRYFLIWTISVFISAPVVLTIVFLKMIYFAIRHRILKKDDSGQKEKTKKNNVISLVAFIMIFCVAPAIYCFLWYIAFTSDVGFFNQTMLFFMVLLNTLFIFRFKDNLLVLFKNIFTLTYGLFLTLVLFFISAIWPRFDLFYAFAFGILLIDIGSYIYVYTTMKPTLEIPEDTS